MNFFLAASIFKPNIDRGILAQRTIMENYHIYRNGGLITNVDDLPMDFTERCGYAVKF